MAKHALSEEDKRRNSIEKSEKDMHLAVQMYATEKKKVGSGRLGLRKVATLHGVKHSTLRSRFKGQRSISQFNAGKQNLFPPEEAILVEFIAQSADRAVPFTQLDIAHHANQLLQKRLRNTTKTVGINWVPRFLGRHRSILQTHWGKHLDSQRAKGLNPPMVREYFDIVEKTLVESNVQHENMYGMDESGFPPSDQGSQQVIG